MSASAWSTIASLATALGTLVLAVATFSAVRSSNLMAKIAQEQFLVQLRPVLTTSRREDPPLKVNFGDTKWVRIPGGGAVGEVGPGDGSMGPDTPVVYLAVALRNAGNGIAVLHGWRFFPDWHRDQEHAPLEEFERQNRDLYIPVGDVGFWQGRSATPSMPGTTRRARSSRPASRGRWNCSTATTRAGSGWSAGSPCCRSGTDPPARPTAHPTARPTAHPPARPTARTLARTGPRNWAGWQRPAVTGTSTVPIRDDPAGSSQGIASSIGRLLTDSAGLPLVLSHPVHHN